MNPLSRHAGPWPVSAPAFPASHITTRCGFLRATAAAGLAACAKPLITFAATPPAYPLGCYTRPWDAFDHRRGQAGPTLR